MNLRRLQALLFVLIMTLSCFQTAVYGAEPADAAGGCTHIHDSLCGYVQEQEEIPCDMGCTQVDENGNILHEDGCAYRPAVEGRECAHIHDASCGYMGQPEERNEGTIEVGTTEEKTTEEKTTEEETGLPLMMLTGILSPRNGGQIIYIANSGSDESEGASLENPTTLAHAVEIAEAAEEDEFVFQISGTVEIPVGWKSPAGKSVTFRGEDADTDKLFIPYGGNNKNTNSVNISLQGNLTFETISLDISPNSNPRLANPFYIVANGHRLVFREDVQTMQSTPSQGEYNGYIYGGGLYETVTGDTYIENHGTLKLVTVYGGGAGADVTGTAYVKNYGLLKQIYGGGCSVYGKGTSANVGNTEIEMVGGNLSNHNLYGGGDAGNYDAKVLGDVTILVDGADNYPAIYGGGYSSSASCSADVVGNVEIIAKNMDLRSYTSNYSSVFGGGSAGSRGQADIHGNVSITLENCDGGRVYGGGSGISNVKGNVTLKIVDCAQLYNAVNPTVYAGGKGTTKTALSSNVGDVEIIVEDSPVVIYTQGSYGNVSGAVKIRLLENAGFDRDFTYGSKIYNQDEKRSEVRGENATVEVEGEVTFAIISGVPEILIKEGGRLNEYSLSNRLLTNCGNVTIEKGGTLDLLQTNEITGNFVSAGTLKLPAPVIVEADECFMIADGEVVVQEGAAYIPTKNNGASDADYIKGDIFLKSKNVYTGNTAFSVSEAGRKNGYFTDDRAASNGFEREWFVDLEERVTVVPASIVIYTGGEGYAGTVDKDGQLISSEDAGFPEPGFYFILPEEIDAGLKTAAGVSDETALDLSDYIILQTEDGTMKWNLELYGEDTSNSSKDGRNIYRIVPDEKNVEKSPVRMRFTDENGEIVYETDQLNMEEMLYSKYRMEIYSERIQQNQVKAVVTIPGEQTQTFSLRSEMGTLTIRGVSSAGSTTPVISNITEPVDTITAVLPEGTEYFVNGSGIKVVQGNPSLLADRIAHSETSEELLKEKALEVLQSQDEELETQYYYLDLVDAENGNTWIQTKNPVTIFWPYPEGTNQDTQFYLVHFSGLNREMDMEDIEERIENCPAEKIQVENTEYGISFTLNGFSPVALLWTQPQPETEYRLTVVNGSGDGIYPEGTKVSVKADDAPKGKVFDKWITDQGGTFDQATAAETIFTMPGNDVVVTALYRKEGESSSGSEEYILHYVSNGGTAYSDEVYGYNTVVNLDKTPKKEGYTFTGWYAEEELETRITQVVMTSDKTVYAGWRKIEEGGGGNPNPQDRVPEMLNGSSHFAYIVGYPDGEIKPTANITRAEVAAIFFRLLEEEVRDSHLSVCSSFTDVKRGNWYSQPIATMEELNILKGRTETEFVPNANITRAEFAAICARFDKGTVSEESGFTDISGHWAESEIERAVSLGWIAGYPDGSFRPDQPITRAEAMAVINRVLCRVPEKPSDLLEDMKIWPDNMDTGKWYYLAVQEATNSHLYRYKDETYETWLEMTKDPDWSRYALS